MINDILKSYGAEFIQAIYEKVLGRQPRAQEMDKGLGLLRDGQGKRQVLLEILQAEKDQSPSGAKEFDPTLEDMLSQAKRERGAWGWLRRGRRLEREIHQLEWMQYESTVELNTDVSHIHQTMTGLAGNILSINHKVGGTAQEVYEKIYPSVMVLQQSIEEISLSVLTLSAKIDAMNQKIDREITGIKKFSEDLNGKIIGTMAALEGKVLDKMQSLEGRILDLEGDVANGTEKIENSIDGFQENIEKKTEMIALRLRENLDTLEHRLENKVKRLEAPVAPDIVVDMTRLPEGAQRLVKRRRRLTIRGRE
ncbi:MAG: hypothetical protein PW843_09460 [Azospirillaceae bacterium]|nr:hypothetical protein [Azospirillaceae bacterium]